MVFIPKVLLAAAVAAKKAPKNGGNKARKGHESLPDRHYDNPYLNFDADFSDEHIEDHERALLGLKTENHTIGKGRRLTNAEANNPDGTPASHDPCQEDCLINHKAFSEYWKGKEPNANSYTTTYQGANGNTHTVCQCKFHMDQYDAANVKVESDWNMRTLGANYICVREYENALDTIIEKYKDEANYEASRGFPYFDNLVWLCEPRNQSLFPNGAIACDVSGSRVAGKECEGPCLSQSTLESLENEECHYDSLAEDFGGGAPETCLCNLLMPGESSASGRRELLTSQDLMGDL